MPYNPSVSYVGDRFLADAYGDFGRSIGSGILAAGDRLGRGMELKALKDERSDERSKQQAEERDRLMTMGEAMGIDSGSLASMSLGELKGTVDSLTVKQAMGVMEERKAQQQQQLAVGDSLRQRFYPKSPKADLSLTEIMAAKGVRDPGAYESALKIEEIMGGTRFVPAEGTTAGGLRYFMTSPNSAQIVQPDQQATPASDRVLPLKLNGEDTGFGMVDLGGGKRQLIDLRTKQAMSPQDIAMMVFTGAMTREQGNEMLKAALSGGKYTPGAPPASTPSPGAVKPVTADDFFGGL